MNRLIEHVEFSIEQAIEQKSKLEGDVLSVEGMVGINTRHFYNNICSIEGCRYLEIGVWKGASFCSAIYKNNTTSVCIDNWSEFGGPKEEFINNIKIFGQDNNITYIEKNSWDVDVSNLGKFNVYLYDGGHDFDSHYKAISYYLPCMDETFIFMVDDWNWQDTVKKATMKAIEDSNLNILFMKEIYTVENGGNGSPDWWNGIGIFVLSKSL